MRLFARARGKYAGWKIRREDRQDMKQAEAKMRAQQKEQKKKASFRRLQQEQCLPHQDDHTRPTHKHTTTTTTTTRYRHSLPLGYADCTTFSDFSAEMASDLAITPRQHR
eukprot:TRINITY_DN1841_c3_g1_i1.p1 TRINITY_DN1841_c3_g1~~TRINITY_DN1841_c3_g1_i1.p1  ORF type:complete len:110 (+),score=23.56 TRINITY_DN1841_c3_g1_i1:285-614(+)